MTAAFGVCLILDLQPGSAGAFIHLHRPPRVQGIPEPGVRIHNDRQVGTVADQGHCICHFRRGGQPDIGPPQPCVSDRGTGQVQRLEPRIRRQRSSQTIIDPRRDKDLWIRQAAAQCHSRPPICAMASVQVITSVTEPSEMSVASCTSSLNAAQPSDNKIV